MLPPKLTEEGVELLVFTDEQGRVVTDLPCPVSCGRCCKHWYQTKALQHLVSRDDGIGPCPKLRPTGCKLKRSRRPIECRMYLCELAALAMEDQVTKPEIDRVLAAEAQDHAAAFLGKQLLIMDRELPKPADELLQVSPIR
ncbi:MAG TPA: hypothetical protein PLC99_20000 [Verrucomicrobiota bacterium]|nr:hypothetical protein [Verrucomicrobiota bacterium]